MKNKLLKMIIPVIGVLLMSLSFPIASLAETYNAISNIGMVDCNIPYVNVEVKYSDITLADVSGKIGSDSYDAYSVTKSKDAKKLTYILIDNTESMVTPKKTPEGSLEEIKKQVNELIASTVDEKNHFVVYSIGNSDPVELGKVKSSDDATAIKSKIDSINGSNHGTNLNRSVESIYETAKENREDYQLVKMLLVTDSEADYSTGISISEVGDYLQYNSVPLYVVCATNKTNNNTVKEWNSTANESGGEGKVFNVADCNGFFKNLYGDMYNTSIVGFVVDKPVDNNPYELSAIVKGRLNSETVKFDRAANINEPVSAEVAVNDTQNAFVISFKQKGFNGSIPVVNATNNEAYKITKNGSDKEYAVQKAEKNADGSYTVTMKDDIYTDKYDFEFIGITDLSSNKNAVQKAEGIEIQAKSKFWLIFPYLLIAAILILFLIAFYLVLLRLKKKKNVKTIREIFETQVSETVEEKHYIQNQNKVNSGKQVQLYFKTGNNPQKRLSLTVTSSIIIGRSDICDVFIDDAKMSRQHFAIEFTQGVFMISDLESANGTYVNGVRVQSRQRLNSGDMIMAGLTSIRIEF